jgi:hypothetical protein
MEALKNKIETPPSEAELETYKKTGCPKKGYPH